MTRKVGRNDPCPCGSGTKYKRCCLESDDRNSDTTNIAPHPGVGSNDFTILVETAEGTFLRRVPEATELRLDRTQGLAAENATDQAASRWGLPDFVWRPAVRRIGSGSREIGDRLILVGELGIVIQIKSREAPSDDPAKERRWLEKNIAKGIDQGRGVIRSLTREPEPLRNGRGRDLRIDGNAYRWIIAVVVDHPRPPSGVTLEAPNGPPALTLLRRDWEFLFDQLKSIHAVAAYFDRVAGESIELGEEPTRYYEFALADAKAPPETLEPAMHGGGLTVSEPLLPLEPAGWNDQRAHGFFRLVLEDIATAPMIGVTELNRLEALAELDRLPIQHRGSIGSFLAKELQTVQRVPREQTEWRFREFRGGSGTAHLAFGVCSQYSDEHRAAFGAWLQLKHHDLQQATGDLTDLTTVGVLLTPRLDQVRPWDTTMVAAHGDLELTEDELEVYRQVWDRPMKSTRQTGTLLF